MANTAKLLVTEGFMLKISVSFSYYIMPDFQQKILYCYPSAYLPNKFLDNYLTPIAGYDMMVHVPSPSPERLKQKAYKSETSLGPYIS